MNQKDGYDNLNPLRGGCCNSSIYKTILQELFHSISASIYFDSAILRKFSLSTYIFFIFILSRNYKLLFLLYPLGKFSYCCLV